MYMYTVCKSVNCVNGIISNVIQFNEILKSIG